MTDTVIAPPIHAIRLPRPHNEAGGDLMHALRLRRSSRAFSSRALPDDLLSTLLWAACGVNRSVTGGLTAPSAHGWREIDVFAALPEGTYRYDSAANILQPLVARDLRALTGVQAYVGGAPLNLVYVADFSRMIGASEEERNFFAATDAAVIAQNVYLFCAMKGLATVVRGLVDRRKLAPALGLQPEQRVVLAQSVGFPADA